MDKETPRQWFGLRLRQISLTLQEKLDFHCTIVVVVPNTCHASMATVVHTLRKRILKLCKNVINKRDLNEEYQAICSNTNPVTQMLFGDNITDQLKSITESNKIGFKADTLHERPYFPEIRLFFRTTTVSTALSSNTEGEGISSRRTAQGTVQCDSQTTCQTLISTCNVAEVSYSNINCIKLAGRLKHFGTQWEQLTTDKSILETVYACTIECIDTPNQTHVRETKLNSKETIVLDREIKGLLLLGVIENTEHCDGEFISTVPKSNGSYRVILNLKSLNESIEYIHFKMESLHAAIRLITPGCFMSSIDLKDAYYTVNVSEEFRKYLRFIWRGQLYQYTCLANGLACAPRKFTKLLKPFFRLWCIWMTRIYKALAECLENVSVTQELLADIGFVINNEKSVFIPTQELVFLGFILNSNTITISLTEQKVQTITLAIQTLWDTLHKKQDKTSALKYNKGNFDSHMTLSAESLIDLYWWLKAVKNSGAPLYRDIPVISLKTDASSKGWGQYVKITVQVASGLTKRCVTWVKSLYIVPKRKARQSKSRQFYCSCIYQSHGGTRSKQCNDIARVIWEYAYQHNIWLTAELVPGKDNYLADREKTKFVSMSCVREQYKDQGLSDNAIDVIMSSWRKSTKKQYTTYINKWNMYCTENNVHVSSPVVCDVINFLDKLFSEGLTYNVLNTARSAISSFICLQNSEFLVGNHPIISRFMRGAFNMRPALPRYVNTWDVSVVIRYLKQQSPTEKLSFKPLTMKLVMLMALLSGQRAQSLQMLDIKNMGHAGDTVTFVINQLIKQTRPGFHVKPITFRRYTYDVDLCVVKTLDNKAAAKEGKLVIWLLVSKNHIKEFQLKTISRWLKSVLTSAGIDTKQFKGHSVRSAATSAAFGTGTSIQTIMNAADYILNF
ncbi:LOW QUALITY PROTEIN: POL-like protein [Mya arenaria]|uniref:POL-like protein n=1 Tax=Mya arenaria TaxID=6604 RepID=A0ABY7EE64_MYAAR|nr:LOW QUALITY PROTEIN: POL-like protein [Mya arenaria]